MPGPPIRRVRDCLYDLGFVGVLRQEGTHQWYLRGTNKVTPTATSLVRLLRSKEDSGSS